MPSSAAAKYQIVRYNNHNPVPCGDIINTRHACRVVVYFRFSLCLEILSPFSCSSSELRISCVFISCTKYVCFHFLFQILCVFISCAGDRETIKNYIRNYSQLLYYALRPNM